MYRSLVWNKCFRDEKKRTRAGEGISDEHVAHEVIGKVQIETWQQFAN